MFKVNEDLSIYATRGDVGFFSLSATDGEEAHIFTAGEVVRFCVYEKKNPSAVVLKKDFPVMKDTEMIEITFSGEEMKFGDAISKPTDYWYEIELNPSTFPQTIVGYDENGPKIFRLYPESVEVT